MVEVMLWHQHVCGTDDSWVIIHFVLSGLHKQPKSSSRQKKLVTWSPERPTNKQQLRAAAVKACQSTSEVETVFGDIRGFDTSGSGWLQRIFIQVPKANFIF